MARVPLRCGIAMIGIGVVLGGWTNTNDSPVGMHREATNPKAGAKIVLAQQTSAHVLTGVELDQFLRGKSLYFGNGGIAEFYADQSYVFRRGKKTWKGRWQIESDQVCKLFDNGRWRCDITSFDGKYYYQIDKKGRKGYVTSINKL